MTMRSARILVALVGTLTPYLARLPLVPSRGIGWLLSYTANGFKGALLIGGLNFICWGTVLLFSLIYNRPITLLLPAVPGFSRLAYLHYDYDLASDAQAALAFIWFPIWAAGYAIVGGIVGKAVELATLRTRRNAA
jgi:hypothetical protein